MSEPVRIKYILEKMKELNGHLQKDVEKEENAERKNLEENGGNREHRNDHDDLHDTLGAGVSDANLQDEKEPLVIAQEEEVNEVETLETEILTAGAPHEGTLGDRVLMQVRENDQRALPIPEDFSTLAAERCSEVHGLTTSPSPCNEVEAAVRRYLEAQHISLSTAIAMRLGYCWHTFVRSGKDSCGEEVEQRIDLPALAYPFIVDNKLVSIKLRSCGCEKGVFTKDWEQVTQRNQELSISPFHIDCLAPERLRGRRVKKLILTEGEKDCLALYEAGYRYFISVPTGASSDANRYLKPFISWLNAVDCVILCGDTDLPGRRMVSELSKYFGGHALHVNYPYGCKDIADVLYQEGVEGVRKVIEGAHVPDTPAIVTVEQLRPSVLEIIDGRYDRGYDLGYGPLTDRHFHLDNNGNLVIVSGQPNCGKSSFINDLAMHLIKKHHRKFLFTSFEYPNKASHIALMLKLYFGREDLKNIPRQLVEKALDFIQTYMAHLDLKDELPTPDNILSLADQYYRRNGLHFLVIDPYIFIQHESVNKNESETDQIKRMLTKFQRWGQTRHITVIIVAHPRKTQSAKGGFTSDLISPDDIAGSAHWKNLADFLFMVRRVETESEHYSELVMYKVRDQQLCSPGNVYYVRTSWGEYIEQPSIDECNNWYFDHLPQMMQGEGG